MDIYEDSDQTDRQSPLCVLKTATSTGFIETGAFYAFSGKKRNKLSFKQGTIFQLVHYISKLGKLYLQLWSSAESL